MQHLINQSALAMAEAIRTKEISAVELLKLHLERIAVVNPKINAVVALDAQRAMIRAKELDALQAKGYFVGPFHGVPFTVKDVYNTKGLVTTLGTLGLRDHIPDHDATIIQRMKNSGAVMLGKTNVSELCSATETDNLVYGPSFNPYNLEHTPGGSSGGEAAIIAAAGSAFGIGSDLAGSLRIPAHYCGLATIRPTIGRVACSYDMKGSNALGIRTGADARLSTDGPIARYVKDLYPLLATMSGSDGVDPHVSDVPLGNPADIDLAALKMGFFVDNTIYTPSDAVANAVSSAVNTLNTTVSSAEEVTPHFMKDVMPLLIELIVSSKRNQATEAALLAYGTKQPSELLRKFLDRVRRESHHDIEFYAAWDKWDYYRSTVMQFLHPFDVLVCPVLPFTATQNHASLWDDHLFESLSYPVGFSLVPCPVATVRVGEDEQGLPIGAQIIAKPWREDIALAVAAELERNLGGWQPSGLV